MRLLRPMLFLSYYPREWRIVEPCGIAENEKDVTDKKLFGVKYEWNIKEWVDGFIDFLVNYDAVVPAKKLTSTFVVQQQSSGR